MPHARAASRPLSRRRPWAVTAGLALVTAGLVAAAGAVVYQQVLTPEPFQAAVGATVTIEDLDVTVLDFSRRADAVAGVNTPQQPLSGPAMPMNSGPMGSGSSMAGMPGMAGMLEKGQERVDLSIVIANEGGSASTLDPTRFTLYSGGRPVELLGETSSSLTDTPLPEGSEMVGNLTFIIPEGTTPLEVRYADAPARIVLEQTPATNDAPADSDLPATGQHGGNHDGDSVP